MLILLEMVRFLVGKGADINAQTNNGETALIQATEWGRLETVRFLVNKGADVNTPDNRGRTPLILAKEKGLQEVVDFFKETVATGKIGG